jgi:hypothetical protein
MGKFLGGGLALALVLFQIGCAESFSLNRLTEAPNITADSPELPDLEPALPFQVCSQLDFRGVRWPTTLDATAQEALKLSLNISGSFEGSDGWANLVGNFDGQGVSLGLLNQNLGQGSLQPLLISMMDKYPGLMQSIFGSARYNSIATMLDQWESSKELEPPMLLFPKDGDDAQLLTIQATSRNQISVNWAVSNLHVSSSGPRLKADWAQQLMRMAATPEYISLQIGAANVLHKKAVAYRDRIQVFQLRAYLLMYDFIVQNGGIYAQDFTDYDKYLKANPNAGATSRLGKILELRLRHVNSQWVEDVKTRKKTIIDGMGTVHGSFRKLETEYCFTRNLTFR